MDVELDLWMVLAGLEQDCHTIFGAFADTRIADIPPIRGHFRGH